MKLDGLKIEQPRWALAFEEKLNTNNSDNRYSPGLTTNPCSGRKGKYYYCLPGTSVEKTVHIVGHGNT